MNSPAAAAAAIQRRAGVTSGLDTFAGLGRREPWLAILMTLFLLSLTGIPPTTGFFGKAMVILAAVQAGQAGYTAVGILAVIAVINAAAAAFYYLRVVTAMYFREPAPETPDFESQMIPRSRSTQPAATNGFSARMTEVA